MPNYLEIVRLNELSFSQREISDMVRSGRPVIKRTIDITKHHKLSYKELKGWEADLIDSFFGPNHSNSTQRDTNYTLPDYDLLSKSLPKPRVTMQLLWEEYVDACRHNNQSYYRLTQFKKYFNEYLSQKSFTHVIKHKAGERVEVDWAGTKIRWIDPHTGEIIYGYLFVAVLPFSGYGFTGKYYRMTELLNDIDLVEFHGNLDKLLKKLMKVDVLVIDDFLLASTKEQEQKYLMEVFELRSRERKSLILCSQMSSSEWHKKLGGGAIADAVLDRACSKSYKLILSGESLRKENGIDTPI